MWVDLEQVVALCAGACFCVSVCREHRMCIWIEPTSCLPVRVCMLGVFAGVRNAQVSLLFSYLNSCLQGDTHFGPRSREVRNKSVTGKMDKNH